MWNRNFPKIGHRFGRLTVTTNAVNTPTGTIVQCRCDCGTLRSFFLGNLRKGHTKSCGCLKIEEAGKQQITHGLSQTPEYHIWDAIIQRCTNPNDRGWHKYGGRGITVCRHWRRFENFIRDMGRRPTPRHSIDRTDNDRGYCPSNCKWVTKKEQSRNTRATRFLEHKGRTMCLAAWAAELGISSPQLHVALKLRGSLSAVIFHRENPKKARCPWEEAGIPRTTWYRKYGPLG